MAALGPPHSTPAVHVPDGGELFAPVGLPARLEVVQVPVSSRVVSNHLQSPTSAVVTVVDPNKLPVQANADPLPSDGSGPMSFSFMPQLPGPYHVTVSFEPDFGETQADVQIAADRTDAGVVERPMPFACKRFETVGGVDFCLDADTDQLVTVVGGQAVSRVDAWDFAQAPGEHQLGRGGGGRQRGRGEEREAQLGEALLGGLPGGVDGVDAAAASARAAQHVGAEGVAVQGGSVQPALAPPGASPAPRGLTARP